MAKLKLLNGNVYNIEDYATQNRFVVLLDSVTASEVLKCLTEENLSEIQFLTDSGEVTGTYYNKLLCGYVNDGNTLEVNIKDVDLCRYGLVLDENHRIISAHFQRYAPEDAIIVDMLPDNNITDYQYINGEFIYNPLPKEEPAEPTPSLEDRVTALENTVNTTVAEYNTILQELGVET